MCAVNSIGKYFLAAAIIAALPAAANDRIPASDYRLAVEQPTAFRLGLGGQYAPLPGPAPEPAIPAHLADRPYAALIHRAAREADLDAALVHAVIHVESRYNPAARSPKGALGLMQVMPDTALRYGVADPGRAPEVNLRVGTRYLKDLMELFEGRLELALAAYNAGENAVMRHGWRIPPYQETRLYVPAVLTKYREWREPPPVPGPVRIEYLPGTRLDPGSVGTGR